MEWISTRFAWTGDLAEYPLVIWLMVAACLFFSVGGAFAFINLKRSVFLGFLMLLPSFGLLAVFIWYKVEASSLDAKANASLDEEACKLQQILNVREETRVRAQTAAVAEAEAKRATKRPFFRNIVIDKPLAIIDLETTGISTQTARIVEIGLIKVLPNDRKSRRIIRLNPGVPIPEGASRVHGIYDADVVDKPLFADVADELLSLLDGCDFCGFNLIRFDIPILLAEFARVDMSLSLRGRAIVDAMAIFHSCVRREAGVKRDLTAAVRLYCDRDHESAHSAGADVLATANVLDAIIGTHDLPRTIPGLHQHFNDQRAQGTKARNPRVRKVREARARQMHSNCQVIQKDGYWLVSSQTIKGVYYTVTREPKSSCTCRDFLWRRTECKHLIFLESVLAGE